MWKRIKKYLSLPWVSVFCILLAIVGKLSMMRIALSTSPDKFAQTVMAHNFLQGHGLSLTTCTMEDLSRNVYFPDNGWPPAYSLLVSLFLPFTGDNYMLAGYLVDCLSALLFFWYCRKLLLLIKFPVWLTNLFLLFQGFFITPALGPTDFLSLTLLMASLFYLVKIIEANTVSPKTILALSLMLVLASFIRYQNIPVALLLTGSWSIAGWLHRKKSWWASGLIAFSCVLLLCGALLLYQHIYTDSAYYLVPAKKGWFPGNLLLMHPFIVTGVLNLHFYAVQLGSIFPGGYRTWTTVAHWAGLPLAILFTIAATWYVFKKRGKPHNALEGVFIFGFVIYITTIGLLVFLSLMIDKYIGPPLFDWTYVMQPRYYVFPAFFFQLFIWWYLFVRPPKNNSLFKSLFKSAFILLTAIEMLHGMYFVVKKSSQGVRSFAMLPNEQPEQAFVISFIRDMQKNDPDRSVAITAFDKRYGFLAGLYGAAGMFSPQVLNEKLPTSSKPAVLLLLVREKELFLMDAFLKQPGVKLLTQIKDFSLYTYYVEPSPGNLP